MNETLNVGTNFRCDKIFETTVMNRYNVLWSHTVTGCRIVQLLQDIYKFNISYVAQHLESNATIIERDGAIYPRQSDHIDVYTRPMSLRPELLDYSYPIQALNKWRFGFLLRRSESVSIFQTFYSKPFTRPVWNCLYGMAFIITSVFYLLKRWEAYLIGCVPEQGITYEMLMVFGAYCQHIPPLYAILLSRRVAYFVFFMFAYVIYSFYTSNLLSHLVNDKESSMDFESLIKSEYECAVVNDLTVYRDYNVSLTYDKKSMIEKTLLNIKSVTVLEGLEGVKSGKTALLSDYGALYPYLRHKFNSDVLCKLTQIDVFTNIKKYFYTSKNFKYKEQFKIGTFRAFETGVLKRLILADIEAPLDCEAVRLVQAPISQISALLCILMSFYVLAIFVLVGEKIHYTRNRLWPYVD